MRKQVSRLGFILLGRLPAFQQWHICPFVSFTVTGIARKSHPPSLGGSRRRRVIRANTHAVHLYIKYKLFTLMCQIDTQN